MPNPTTADELLHPKNHALFDHIRMMLVARDPAISWEEIAFEFGFDDPQPLIEWFLAYELPKRPTILPTPAGLGIIRDPELRAERARLRRRETELFTMATEAPEQLERIQRRIVSIERSH